MANDLSLEVRRALIAKVKELAWVIADVAGGVHASVPDPIRWPYIRFDGRGLTVPFRSTGNDGCDVPLLWHVFTQGETDDQCRELSRLLARDLDAVTLPLGGAAKLADVRWTDTQVLSDIGKADGWHGLVRFVGAVVA